MPRRNPLDHLNCGPVTFSGDRDALYERHLTFDAVVPIAAATARDLARQPVSRGLMTVFSAGDSRQPDVVL